MTHSHLIAGLLLALPLLAQTPRSVTLTCNGVSTEGVTGYNFYRAPCDRIEDGACVNQGQFTLIGNSPTCAYQDTSVTSGQKWIYYVTSVCPVLCSPSESAPSNTALASIPSDSILRKTHIRGRGIIRGSGSVIVR